MPERGPLRALRALGAGRRFEATEEEILSPTYVPDLVNATLDLLIDGEPGDWHLTNPSAISWADLARRAAEIAGLDPSGVTCSRSAPPGRAAPWPSYRALASARGSLLPPQCGAPQP